VFLEINNIHPSQEMLEHFQNVFSQLNKEELKLRMQEFLKFLYLASKKGNSFIPLSKEIDEIWHTYILQTQEYYNLCMDLPGKVFIHHKTTSLKNYSEGKQRQDNIKNMLSWLPLYYRNFGEFKDEVAPYWMMVQFLSKELGLTLEQINKFAKDEAKNA